MIYIYFLLRDQDFRGFFFLLMYMKKAILS